MESYRHDKKNAQTVPINVCVGYSFHLFLESLLLVEAFWASDFPNTVPPLIWAGLLIQTHVLQTGARWQMPFLAGVAQRASCAGVG